MNLHGGRRGLPMNYLRWNENTSGKSGGWIARLWCNSASECVHVELSASSSTFDCCEDSASVQGDESEPFVRNWLAKI